MERSDYGLAIFHLLLERSSVIALMSWGSCPIYRRGYVFVFYTSG
jgi:hypothetical protein